HALIGAAVERGRRRLGDRVDDRRDEDGPLAGPADPGPHVDLHARQVAVEARPVAEHEGSRRGPYVRRYELQGRVVEVLRLQELQPRADHDSSTPRTTTGPVNVAACARLQNAQ